MIGQIKPQVSNINATGDGAGGLRINRCTDAVVKDVTTADQPIGLFLHVNSTNVRLENLNLTGGRRGVVVEKTTKGLQISQLDDRGVPGWPGSPSAVTTSRWTASR